MSNQIGIGSKLYEFNENTRVYLRRNGGPSYRGHFIEVDVIGETRVSWVVGPNWSPRKVNKKDIMSGRAGCYFTKDAMELQIWRRHNEHRIKSHMSLVSTEMLKAIAEMIGYESVGENE